MNEDLLTLQTVRTVPIGDDTAFPRLHRPEAGDAELACWLAGRRAAVTDDLHRYGAVLLRGFDVSTAAHFHAAVRAITDELESGYGDLPKADVGPAEEGLCEEIYRATPYPPHLAILFHNEASHTPRWPRYQFFGCLQPAAGGGETPLVDGAALHASLPEVLRAPFDRLGLRYSRNFIRGLDVPWSSFFGTDDRREVEERCLADGIDCEWRPGGGLRTHYRRPATIRHPESGHPVFFNQAQLHHVACLEPKTREALLELFDESEMPRSLTFGDGSPIPGDTMEELVQRTCDAAIAFSWQRGDVLMVDNLRVAHARRPYRGPRSMVVAMSRFQSAEGRHDHAG